MVQPAFLSVAVYMCVDSVWGSKDGQGSEDKVLLLSLAAGNTN